MSRESLPVPIDLSAAAIVLAADRPVTRAAAQWLRDEIARRAGVDWPVIGGPSARHPEVVIGTAADFPTPAAGPADGSSPEAYTITVDAPRAPPGLTVCGRTDRACLFAVGRLLRLLEVRRSAVTLSALRPGSTQSWSPRFPIRGHQLGYRGIPNTYDAWDTGRFEQYVRDLLVFGVNSVELVPTLDPAEPASPIMPLPPWEMNIRLSALLARYGLDVWVWLPVEDGDPSDEATCRKMVARRRRLFESMSRLDHVFVPGGDPGHVPPDALLPFLEKLASVLRRDRPQCGLWVSPQGFSSPEMTYFYDYLRQRRPDWLTGVVFGPWVRDPLPVLRERVPDIYRVRRYPDISHCVRCQYPVPEWDRAFALTLGREPVNPRPSAYAHIHNLLMGYADGAITYSEGVTDDVNKAVWAERLWDPDRPVAEILVDYGRAYFRTDVAAPVADAIFALEGNWKGALANSPQPRATLEKWRWIEQRAGPDDALDWRLAMHMFRATYDVFVQERLLADETNQRHALAALERAADVGSGRAAAEACAALAASDDAAETGALRGRIEALAAELWRSIGLQTSVGLYGAEEPERGAVLDFLDAPLNDRGWLEHEIAAALAAPGEPARAAGLAALTRWEDPGPGGYYDDLGDARRSPRVARGEWENDPGRLVTAQEEFGAYAPEYRLSWADQACTLYGAQLVLEYTDLDGEATYTLRVIYNGRFHALMRLVANGAHVIHGPIRGTAPPEVMEFPIPRAATARGVLRLEWHLIEGRGCQVAEAWLTRDREATATPGE